MTKTGAGNRRVKAGRVEGPGPEVGEEQEGRRAQVALAPGGQERWGARGEGAGATATPSLRLL